MNHSLTALAAFCAVAAGCQNDIYQPENLGKLGVTVDIVGEPTGSVVIQWSDLDSPAEGRDVWVPRNPRNTFEQVPLGLTRVFVQSLPSNCLTTEGSKTVEVVRSETREVAFSVECT